MLDLSLHSSPGICLCLVLEARPKVRRTMQLFLWLFDFLDTRHKSFVPSNRKRKERYNTVPYSMSRHSEGKWTLYAHDENIPFPNAFVVWVQGCSWGALHTKSQVSRLLMSRNKWLQQMRKVQGNSKTEYFAVHQLLSHCQAFCQLHNGGKK